MAQLIKIWNEVIPEFVMDCDLMVAKENDKKKKEIEKIEKKKKEQGGPFCEYIWGPKSQKNGSSCGEFCKNSEPASDGKTYCNRHIKQIMSKHKCEFINGDKTKNPGTKCGANIKPDAVIFSLDGEYKGNSYKNCWLCKKHTSMVENNMTCADESIQCQHIYTDKSKTHASGERCDKKAAKDSIMCGRHKKGNAKSKASKATDQKKKELVKESEEDKSEEKSEQEVEVESKTKSPMKSTMKSGKISKPEDKLMVVTNFKLVKNKARKENFVHRKKINDERESFYIFVDTNSGLVYINPNNESTVEIDTNSLTALGIWDNDDQTYAKLVPEAAIYAKAAGHKLYQESDD